MNKNIKSYSIKLTEPQMKRLTEIVHDGNWEISEAPYAHWRAGKKDISLTAYMSGKVTVQGKGTGEFLEFVLEPEVTGILPDITAAGGQQNTTLENKNTLPLPHTGIDESGKGDFFGPLVIAAVFVDTETELPLLNAGVKDSKLIRNDAKIISTANSIRTISKGRFAVVPIGPEAYNRLYENIGNLNKLLAWGHARVLENILERVPECKSALSDKFGHSSLIENALLKKGRSISLHQQTKGERDIAVAAASILARDEFIRRLKNIGEPLGVELPRGASAKVEKTAAELVAVHGPDILSSIAKKHFKTTAKIIGR